MPTLFLKSAEMQALEHLSASEKDRILPVFPLRPWLRSGHLDRSFHRVELAFGNRNYFLDLDRYYTKENDRPAWHEFRKLHDPTDAFANWRRLVQSKPHAIPCLRLLPLNEDSLVAQVHWAVALGRGFAIRIEREVPPAPDVVLNALASVQGNNYVVILDAGWDRDLLSSELWASGWISQITQRNAAARIVISGSSFPESFVEFGTFGIEEVQEHPLHGNLVRRHNDAIIIYGDWASTRRPKNQGGAINYPRIDLAYPTRWIFFRAASEETPYRDVARQAVASEFWSGDLSVWGNYNINNTALQVGYTINAPLQATSARINIHLHEQISLRSPNMPATPPEEDFED